MECFLDRARRARLCAAAAVLLVCAASAGADTLSISWDPSSSSDVVGYRVYLGTTTGVYTSSVDVGLVTSWDFTAAVAGTRYCFAVASYTADASEGQKSFGVCGYSNRVPLLTNPGAQATADGQRATLQLVGSDPDGYPVTFTATGLPPGLTIHDATGFIEGTPTTRGTYSVTARVSDGLLTASQTFTWTVHSVPDAPVLISPSSTSTPVSPTFVWQAVAGASTYRLSVDDAGVTSPKLLLDVTGVAAGCATGVGSCQLTPSTTLELGAASWTVRASNTFGEGPWATPRAFAVLDGTAPTISITTPSTSPTVSTGSPTITIGGTASDSGGVTSVAWVNTRGGSGTATGTTNWSATVALEQGANAIVVTVVDNSGNASTDTVTVTYIDEMAPIMAIQSPTSGGTFETEESSVLLRGTATDSFGVTEVRWVNDRGGSGAAAGTANWVVAGVDLRLGRNVVTVTARDAAGHSTSSVLVVTMVDLAPPIVDISSPTTLATYGTNRDSLALAGGALDDRGVSRVIWRTDRGSSGTAEGTTSWRVPNVPLHLGANTITVVAQDASGNETAETLVVTVTDTSAPTVQIEGPTADSTALTQATSLRLTGRSRDDFGVARVSWVNNRGGGGTAAGTSEWVAAADLYAGTNVLTITASDESGNRGTDTITVVVDTTPPAVTIDTPTSGYRSTTAMVTMSGTAGDANGIAQVRWQSDSGGSGTTFGSTEWLLPFVQLHDGANTITITAVDTVGNSAEARLVVTYDAVDLPPTLTISEPSAQMVTVSTPAVTVAGSVADDHGAVELTWINDRGGSGSISAAGVWMLPSIALQSGANVITVSARDTAGHGAVAQVLVDYTPAVAVQTAPALEAPSRRVAQVPSPNEPPSSPVEPIVPIEQPAPAPFITSRARAPQQIPEPPQLNMSMPPAQPSQAVAQPRPANVPSPPSAPTEPPPSPAPAPPVPDAPQAPAPAPSSSAPPTSSAPALAPESGTETPRAESLLEPKLTAPRRTPPRIVIAEPAGGRYTTTAATVTVGGTANLPGGVLAVTWSGDKASGGQAVGTEAWRIEQLPLALGTNVIIVTASDGGNEIVTAQLVVVRTEPLGVSITTPATERVTTTDRAIALAGATTGEVTKVTWSADWGGTGTASGTKAWRIDAVGLERGVNVITVMASDAEGRVVRRVLTITSNPPAPRGRIR